MRRLRRGSGARRADTTDQREMVKDDRLWVVEGHVYVPPDASSHYEIEHGDGGSIRNVWVEVLAVPTPHDLTCRLGVGAQSGFWEIPTVGTRVLVSLPDGEIDNDAVIVAVFGNAPGRLQEGRTILVSSGTVEITAPKVLLGPDPVGVNPLTDGFVHGTAQDSYTGLFLWQLGGMSTKVQGQK